jgi:hypothetical protein
MVIRTQWTQFHDVPPGAVGCISVDGHDADEALLHALEGTGVSVVPGSQCTWDTTPGSHVRDSSQPALLVNIRSHLYRGEVVYHSQYNMKWGSHIVLKVRRENGAWTIIKVLEHWEA